MKNFRRYQPMLRSGKPRPTALNPWLGLAAAANGASIFRVHDAAEHLAAFKVFDAIRRA